MAPDDTPTLPDDPDRTWAEGGGANADSDDVPRVIGHYHLTRPLGEGGMGEVWEAEQVEPVRRRVALKVIKRGMDSREIVARFESERQALAMMDHPCIAKVFDAGTTERGRPYFVMEFVPGVPITEHCDRHRLDTRSRLELFIQVCEGVQHAHQKAIIHRDLKPSNILVAEDEGGKAIPKIIDFGVAKATGQSLTEKTMYTAMGQIIGTPEYMSPEQADFTGANIDTRTDVYALGVVLYVLLVGALPFDPTELKRLGFDEMRRRILEVDPPRPSTRFISLGNDSYESATARNTESKILSSQLRGDLDWITMKALEKDRRRRYDSPTAMAEDIRRYLRDEPILARPPSTAYRTRKFVRRHKVGVTVASLLLVLLVAFAATMTVQAGRIARERDRANLEAETARRVTDFLVDLFELSDPSEALGNTVTARQILDEGAERIRVELDDQPQIQGRLMHTIGEVYRKLGLYAEATPLLEEAVEILKRDAGPEDKAVAEALERLANLRMRTGDYEGARPLFDSALEIQRRGSGPDHPTVARILNNIGTLHFRTGDLDGAEAAYERALAIYEKRLGADDPQVARTLNNLAILSRRRGNDAKARGQYERSLAIIEKTFGPDHPDVAQALNNLANLLRSSGDLDGALPLLQRAVAIREKVFGPGHPDVARSLNNLGNLLTAKGRFADALRVHERALAIREAALGPRHDDVAQSLNNLAIAHKSMGRYERARELYERALTISEEALGPDHPKVATGYYNLAGLAAVRGDRDRALALLRVAVERGFANPWIRDDPDLASLRNDPAFRELLARVLEAAQR